MPIYVPVTSPQTTILVPASDLTREELSRNSQHRNAIKAVLSNRDPWAALAFEGETIGDIPLATHPDDIEALDQRGELDDQYYVHISPS